METITAEDVVRLANAVSIKCSLNVKINEKSQCTSDLMLSLYYAVMGELPTGVLSDCITEESQVHNVACIIDTLADEYLHVDLSHLSPKLFVNGDTVTIYNLLEILDGVLEFMLEQISSNGDSGDEGDIDSDQLSEKPVQGSYQSKSEDHDSSVCTQELLDLDTTPRNASPIDDKLSISSDKFFPLVASESSSVTADDWAVLKSSGNGSISEHTLEPTELEQTLSDSGDKTDSLIRLGNVTKSFSKSLKLPVQKEKLPIDNTSGMSKSVDLRSTYTVKNPPKVTVEVRKKGTELSVSDFTSDTSDADTTKPPQVFVDTKQQSDAKDTASTVSTASSDGEDVPDGIPKPNLSKTTPIDGSSIASDHFETRVLNQPSVEEDRITPPVERDWAELLKNLQKTVEESRKIREKFFTTPAVDTTQSFTDPQTEETLDTTGLTSEVENDTTQDSLKTKLKQRNVRFEDTISTKTGKDLEKFKNLLRKEKELQNLKNKVLAESYQDHLEEVEFSERRKMGAIVKKAADTDKKYKLEVQKQRKQEKMKTGRKKEISAAARSKGWQTTNVCMKRRLGSSPIRKKLSSNLTIGEHDLLPMLMDEFPGLHLSPTTLNNAWKKQFRQIEVITSNEARHMRAKKSSEKQLQEAHERHQLLTAIIQREHDHTHRVREARERLAGRREAMQKQRDRKNQTARVRRYYRDYQLQMKARMLKRRTREENLFKNLFEEGLQIQRNRLREIRTYARDKRDEQQKRQKNEIASLENYYKDQFAVLAETLEKEKDDLRTRDKAQTTLLRQMKTGLREKMEREVSELQERIARDDHDIYYRELEADRIRRQLQMATYHAKFKAP
uniref:centrosomal protein of 95 kDa-like n=1 Tax=Ciona intestinalis TaxID=7719 RepID=UPI000180C574|nr:centrosomal protein of 95 kDa-like [Ciona intestinalis]|eukprot:XP_002124068.1 centrosomal protein of 95 kDa-like [Ciona intestinalis]